ncbi:hypothetical protein [Hyalangium minutum]|uniref:DUF4340 domain-containing protein n=1 Tax=Hyalangium minutum TaxID=394096 RepID=A0A085WJD6_9BACT|nr:hypothetical protein [Hyalangium minutum]KFE67799.1 hypothetical protein DB31_8282 [Hyalangium minutum]
MNARGLALQGGLAALGLVAAFLTWQREPEGQPGEVTVLDLSKRALQKVRYEDPTRFAELFRNPQDEDRLWVRVGDKPKPPPPAPPPALGTDGGVPGGTDGGAAVASTVGAVDAGVSSTPPTPPPPPPPRELRANANAETLWGRLAPVKGSRSLGELDAKKLEELGLVNSPRKLTFTVDGREQVLALAAPTGGAWGTPYALREDGKVFLLVTTLLPDLENAMSRLVDRRLHLFEEGDYDSITVSAGKNSRTFTSTGKPPTPVVIAPQNAPDKPDEFVRNWHDRVWRMMAMDVLGQGEEPPGGAPEEQVRIGYGKGGKEMGFLVLAKNPKGEYFARSEHSAGWVRLHAGFDTLVNEAIKIASGT